MMINNRDFANAALIPYQEGWGYIWGASGQLWTVEAQAQATREQTVKYGKKWIGKRVVDCSGLVLWSVQRFGGSVYHGSNSQFKKNCSATGKLINGEREDGKPLKIGTLVFKTKGTDRYHVGVYTGDGLVTEAHGTYQGVIQTSITIWNEWGELSIVDYTGEGLKPMYKAKVVTAKDNLNVRDEPKKDPPEKDTSRVIGTFERGSIVNVLSIVNDGAWAYATNGKLGGYVSTKYLEKVEEPEKQVTPTESRYAVEIVFNTKEEAGAFLAALACAKIRAVDGA